MKPCPFCASDKLETRSLAMDWDELDEVGLRDDADELGCIQMVECRECFAQAPASRWNTRMTHPTQSHDRS